MEGKRQQNKSRIELFNNEERIKLIGEVQQRPILWDLTDKQHFDAIFIKCAWESVAEALKKPVQDCKAAWRSLRDSYKYHIKASDRKRKKSGSAGGVGPQPPRANDTIEWHLAPHMAFLPDLSTQRRTYSSGLDDSASSSQGCKSNATDWEPLADSNSSFCSLDTSQANAVEEDVEQNKTSCDNTSSYSYQENPSKRAKLDTIESSKEVIGKLGQLIDRQVNMLSGSSSGVISAAVYWSDIIKGFQPEKAQRATQAVTKLLWEFENEPDH
ncbi:hypothetical protein ACLKA6_001417 [Drosophila palustris]